MRNGFLLLLLIVSCGCSHDSQFEPTHCGWGDNRGTPESAAAADRAAAEAWRSQQQRLINAGNPPPSN
jgi:hypothetical protein